MTLDERLQTLQCKDGVGENKNWPPTRVRWPILWQEICTYRSYKLVLY